MRIKKALADMQAQVGDGGTGWTGDREFHAAVVAASHSPLLERILGQLVDSVERISEASLVRPGQPQRSLATHAEIVDAIDRGDDEAAYQLMFSHLVVTGSVQAAATTTRPA
jgi:GntR family transcriptional repressor for pyruvate dehydrogenase complex